VRQGDRDFHAVSARGIEALGAAGFRPEYFAIRRAEDLQMPRPEDSALRILAGAWLGQARLIDNVGV
jgi:pantoate--beta-alanine ligase